MSSQQFMFDALDDQKESLSDMAAALDHDTRGHEGEEQTPEIQPKRFMSAEKALSFITAGNAYFTLRSMKTGTRYTFRIARPKRAQEKNEWFYYVSLLNGPDNTHNYTYMGWIKKERLLSGVTVGGNAHLKPGAPSVVAINWALKMLSSGVLPDTLEIWHEGRCGRCGRKLTVPESVELGIGPECAGKMGL